VASLAPDSRQLGALTRAQRGLLLPPEADSGETVTFPMVFPAFDKWTTIRFEEPVNRIRVAVKNYSRIKTHLDRAVRARRLAKKYMARMKPHDEGEGQGTGRTENAGYVLVGYVRNEMNNAPGKYVLRLVNQKAAEGRTVFYVRADGDTVAELRPIGSGTIAEYVRGRRTPQRGDAAFVPAADRDRKGKGQGRD
jgi:hypothetical protein